MVVLLVRGPARSWRALELRAWGTSPVCPVPTVTMARTEKPRAKKGMREEPLVRLSGHGHLFWQRCEDKASPPQSLTLLFFCHGRSEQSTTAFGSWNLATWFVFS